MSAIVMDLLRFRRSFRGWISLDQWAGTVLKEFPPDHTGTKTYRINSLGFRGPEYDPAARRHVYAIGCSITLGTGLEEAEIWCHHFHERYAAHAGLRPDEVNLMNFGMTGASNAEIVRTAIAQCEVKAPDLAIVQFTFPERYEFAYGDLVVFIGPWTPTAEWMPAEVREAAADHYRHYNDEQGTLDLFRNLLMAQHYFLSRRIDYLLAVTAPPKRMTPVGRLLARQLDHRRIVWLPSRMRRLEKTEGFVVDQEPRAVDGLHYGPSVHRVGARLVWERFEDLRPLARG